MRKSELRQIIREELTRMIENKGSIKSIKDFKKGDKIGKKVIDDIDIFPQYVGVWFTDGSYKRYTPDSTLRESTRSLKENYDRFFRRKGM